jgi:RNA:NAD 2'-phosphotransferase (TPT1/KptA family)
MRYGVGCPLYLPEQHPRAVVEGAAVQLVEDRRRVHGLEPLEALGGGVDHLGHLALHAVVAAARHHPRPVKLAVAVGGVRQQGGQPSGEPRKDGL